MRKAWLTSRLLLLLSLVINRTQACSRLRPKDTVHPLCAPGIRATYAVTGEFKSTNYPHDYAPYQDCVYMVYNHTGDGFNGMHVRFEDYQIAISKDCREDNLTISKFPVAKYSWDVKKSCHPKQPFTIVVEPGNGLKVHFKTNAYTSARGWRFTWKPICLKMYFGTGCQRCNCKNDRLCDKETGACPQGECAPLFKGIDCQTNGSIVADDKEQSSQNTDPGMACTKSDNVCPVTHIAYTGDCDEDIQRCMCSVGYTRIGDRCDAAGLNCSLVNNECPSSNDSRAYTGECNERNICTCSEGFDYIDGGCKVPGIECGRPGLAQCPTDDVAYTGYCGVENRCTCNEGFAAWGKSCIVDRLPDQAMARNDEPDSFIVEGVTLLLLLGLVQATFCLGVFVFVKRKSNDYHDKIEAASAQNQEPEKMQKDPIENKSNLEVRSSSKETAIN